MYEGRTYEELRKVKISDMTGEEFEHFKAKGKVKRESTPFVQNIFYGTKGIVRDTISSITDKAEEAGEYLSEITERERTLAKKAEEQEKVIEELRKKIKSQT